jgi:NAD(P)-dependent dehydrogenase (short-subunit alcohol dehydrogenase family)
LSEQFSARDKRRSAGVVSLGIADGWSQLRSGFALSASQPTIGGGKFMPPPRRASVQIEPRLAGAGQGWDAGAVHYKNQISANPGACHADAVVGVRINLLVFGRFPDALDEDIHVNNTGIDTTSVVAEMDTAMWDQMMAANLRSVLLSMHAVLKPINARKLGRSINIASQLGHKGAPEVAHYAAAKAGGIRFTKSLAYEVARDGVTVNAICPGPIETELFHRSPEEWRKRKLNELPIGRPGQVEEIARQPSSSPLGKAPFTSRLR